MGTFLKLSSRVLLANLLLGVCLICAPTIAAETDPAGLRLQAANNAFNGAFSAVLGAEKAGANVTRMLDQLNSAADLLAQAEIAYRIGDFNSASVKAESVVSQSSVVQSSAQAAESGAVASTNDAFAFAVEFSAVGCLIFVLVLFFVWRRLRSDYFRNAGNLKPQVVDNEA